MIPVTALTFFSIVLGRLLLAVSAARLLLFLTLAGLVKTIDSIISHSRNKFRSNRFRISLQRFRLLTITVHPDDIPHILGIERIKICKRLRVI